jgi:hypothetical protein
MQLIRIIPIKLEGNKTKTKNSEYYDDHQVLVRGRIFDDLLLIFLVSDVVVVLKVVRKFFNLYICKSSII